MQSGSSRWAVSGTCAEPGVAAKFERSAVLGDGPNRSARSPRSAAARRFQRHRDVRILLAGEVRDHLFRDPAGIAPDPRRIERNGSVETPRKARDSRFRVRGTVRGLRNIRSRAFVLGRSGPRRRAGGAPPRA
jgi:hypothetical protein